MSIDNPILDFNWEKDLAEAPAPPDKYSTMNFMPDNAEDSLLPHMFCDSDLLVQRDSKDVLKLESGVGYPVQYPACAWTWMQTLDRYIQQYCSLRLAMNDYGGKEEWINPEFPEKIHNRLGSYIDNREEGRPQRLTIDTDSVRYDKSEKEKRYGKLNYYIPRYGGAFYYNYLCRCFTTDPMASTSLLAPQQDGVAFWVDKEGKYPTFELEDYWLHEIQTGISLTIEIAAIFLELRGKAAYDELWDKALDAFIHKALPTIVSSPYLFARNTVARLFFQQIYMEQVLQSYRWEGASMTDSEENRWNSMIDRAVYHINTLEYPMENYCVPDEQIEESIAHLKQLLSAVKSPVDIMAYIKEPQHGLALFCNREHAQTRPFLKKLNTTKNSSIRMDKNNQMTVFAKVRKAVKDALRLTNRFFRRENDNVAVFVIAEDIPAEAITEYAALANKDGGAILLARPVNDNHVVVPGQGKISQYLKSASIMVSEFEEILSDSSRISKNLLEKKSIRVWECISFRHRCKYEIIEIDVPKAGTEDGNTAVQV